jgi:hypothetical protein
MPCISNRALKPVRLGQCRSSGVLYTMRQPILSTAVSRYRRRRFPLERFRMIEPEQVVLVFLGARLTSGLL